MSTSRFESSKLGGSSRDFTVSIKVPAAHGLISSGMEHKYSDPGNFAVKPTLYKPTIEFCVSDTSRVT